MTSSGTLIWMFGALLWKSRTVPPTTGFQILASWILILPTSCNFSLYSHLHTYSIVISQCAISGSCCFWRTAYAQSTLVESSGWMSDYMNEPFSKHLHSAKQKITRRKLRKASDWIR
ncbi:uncharacterized protein C8R40DRAFT_496688 [Lentinula edodes]|uniref:uncharacterized protein n=1 Tax=Lentinula edodes TaxID=5353 RepID=UPI001E8EC3F9|nr:uncharacterized protein C8R40DRAFT_496688 [Lentinula edodes]KAH7872359.1 hypothetical protein C8R40DRAFT_496688 [Lentinula edodes]